MQVEIQISEIEIKTAASDEHSNQGLGTDLFIRKNQPGSLVGKGYTIDIFENGVKVAKVELYAGSSDLNTQEFSVLLDGVLQECQNVGVNVDYESRELKNLLEGK